MTTGKTIVKNHYFQQSPHRPNFYEKKTRDLSIIECHNNQTIDIDIMSKHKTFLTEKRFKYCY